ncbi:MAG: HD domain-containing protein [Patescibacteria group bacterium]|nr:HD domain-containing protein [Patescibacteria group bacterium]
MNKVNLIKELVKGECDRLGFVPDWFYGSHLLAVEKFSKFLLKNLPKADKEMVMLGVWLHDLQRIRSIKGDHQKIGAKEAGKVLEKYGYTKDEIIKVKNIIRTHSCSDLKPKTLEGKILASADAMSHYVNDFYIKIAISGERNLDDYKKWALEKLNRDYNKKIFFSFAKKEIKERHNALKKVFTMK